MAPKKPLVVIPSQMVPGCNVEVDLSGNVLPVNSGNFGLAAASGTTLLGGAGAVGDYLNQITIIPLTTSPAAVQIKDGSGSAITVFVGGASSVQGLAPMNVFIEAASKIGGWSIICGANVQVLYSGSFSS
jgi:hypothetical protein